MQHENVPRDTPNHNQVRIPQQDILNVRQTKSIPYLLAVGCGVVAVLHRSKVVFRTKYNLRIDKCVCNKLVQR
eukprot:3003559-Amphidinium_carterae.1